MSQVAAETRYIRRRGTATVFAFSPALMSRGDMVFYDGPIPVPQDFVVPQQELDMIEAVQDAKEGRTNPLKRNIVTTYLRKIGTRDIFASTPTLIARGDMVHYLGEVPVPEEFVIPNEEIEMLVFQGKMKRPPELVEEPVSILGEDPTADQKMDEWERPPDVPKNSEEKILRIMDIIKTLGPEDFRKDGLPNATVIRKRLGGIMVRKDERDEAWERVKAESPTPIPNASEGENDNTGHSDQSEG